MTPYKNELANSRRKFIRNSAIIGSSFFIVPRHVLGRGFVAPSDKLNIGAIGAGGKGGESPRGDRKPFNKGGKPDARTRK